MLLIGTPTVKGIHPMSLRELYWTVDDVWKAYEPLWREQQIASGERRRQPRIAVPLIWLFVIVCVGDLFNVTRIIFEIDFFSYDIGGTWTFLMWFLPWVVISLFYTLYRLFNRSHQVQAN
ncbi:MAG: hypothetical protein ACFE0Q_00060 [Anaerolineae bacterium]